METFNSYLEVITRETWIIIPVGLFLGLLGYRLFRTSVFLSGLFLGLILGNNIGQAMENSSLGILLGLALGIIFGLAAYFLIRFSLFLAGMAGGAALASWILPYTEVAAESTEMWLWLIGSAFAGGLVTMSFHRIFLMIMTSLLGTYLIFLGTSFWFPKELQWIWIPYLILFIVFLSVQHSSIRGRSHPIDRLQVRRKRR